MRRVIPEIARRDVVNLVNDVVARDEVRIAALARVMDVRRVHRSEKRNQHRNDEHEECWQRSPIGQTRNERDDEECRQDQRALMRGVFVANFVRARIRLERVPHGVFEPAHRTAVIILPARFIFFLVEIIHMMTKRMVQNPGVRRDARLQRIHLFEQAIENRRFERRHVLVMMVERANTALGEDADQRVRHERPWTVHERVHQNIAAEDQGKTEDRNFVLLISKDTHECLDRRICEEGISSADVRTRATIAAFPRPGRNSFHDTARVILWSVSPWRVFRIANPLGPPRTRRRNSWLIGGQQPTWSWLGYGLFIFGIHDHRLGLTHGPPRH